MAKKLVQVFLNSLQKNPNSFFGQPDINKGGLWETQRKIVTCAWEDEKHREGFMEEEKGDGLRAGTLQAGWMGE